MITWLRRRVLPLILVVAMLASYLPLSAFADEGNFWDIHFASASSISAQDIRDQFELKDTDTFRIVTDPNDADNSVVYQANAWNVGSGTWSCDNNATYTLQRFDVKVVNWKPKSEWTTIATFTTRFYSNVTVTSAGAEGGVTISGGSFGDQTVSGTQTFKLYQDEQATITVAGVEGYTIGGIEATGVNGDSSPYTATYGTDATVNVTYAADTEATIQLGDTNGAVVTYGDTSVNGSFTVPGGEPFAVKIDPPENQYVSAVALGESPATTLSYNEDGTYTATLPAVATGTTQTLSVTCAQVIGVDSYLEIPYTPGVTSADELKTNILGLVKLPDGVNPDDIKIEYSPRGNLLWVELNADNITNRLYRFEEWSKIRFTFDGNDAVPGATVTCDYETVDARQATEINANNVRYGYGEAVTEDQLRTDIAATVYAGETPVEGASVTISDSDTVTKLATGDLETGDYQITLSYAGDATHQPTTAQVTVTITDNRNETRIDVQNASLEIPYDPDLTEEKLIEMLGVSVVDTTTGAAIPDAAVTVKDVEFPLAIEEAQTITLTYAGDKTQYQPAECTVTVTVTKGDAKVTVRSKFAKYDEGSSVNASQLITYTPADAKHIDVAVGFGVNDENQAVANAYVNLPINLDDILDSLPTTHIPDLDAFIKEQIKNAVESAIANMDGQSMSISQLSSALTELLNAIKKLEDTPLVNLGIDTSSVETLINLLEQVQNLDMQVTVHVSLDKDIQLTDAGAYLVAGIVSDPNYNQAMNLGTVIIAPDAERVKLAFDYDISNGVVTPSIINSEDVSMGAHVEGIDLNNTLNTKVNSIFFGIQNGKFTVSESPSSETGAYTQLAYLKDFGNTISYALPIMRSYVVVPDTAKITLEPANGTVTYDGNAHGVTATVTDNAGNTIAGAVAKVYYTGIQSNGELYYSAEAPTESGYYTVVASYVSADKSVAGAAMTTLTIQPAASSISVDDQVVTYNGEPVNINSLIHKTPAEADVAIMTAGLSAADGDWSNITGTVNIDLPDYVDTVLQKIVPDAYTNGLNLTTFKERVTELQQTMNNAGLKADALDYVVKLLDRLPDAVTITLKDQSEVNPTEIGAYLVSASVFDPNYAFNTDTGIVIIAPDVTKAKLDWNATIPGGVLTTSIAKDFDFAATAAVNGTKNDTITGKIQYRFVGLSSDGTFVSTTDATKLTNGAYTEIAYLVKDDGTAIDIAKPIVRSFVIKHDDVTLELLDQDGQVNYNQTYTYDGNPKDVKVNVKDSNGNVITIGENMLTVVYSGVDSLGRLYNSTTAPTKTGYYTVFASYVEKDENGQLVRAGATMGKLTIKAGTATFDLKDTTVDYDGTEKCVEMDNPQNLNYIAVITDKDNNVNIIFPEAWKVPTKSYDVAGGIDTVLEFLNKLPTSQHGCTSEALSKLTEMLKDIEINTLKVNGAYPVEVGTYDFRAVGFSSNYSPVSDQATLVIRKAAEPTKPSEGNNNNNTSNTTTTTNNSTNVTVNNNTTATPAPAAAAASAVIPQTGDALPVGLLGGVAVIAAAAFVALLVLRKRKHND